MRICDVDPGTGGGCFRGEALEEGGEGFGELAAAGLAFVDIDQGFWFGD